VKDETGSNMLPHYDSVAYRNFNDGEFNLSVVTGTSAWIELRSGENN